MVSKIILTIITVAVGVGVAVVIYFLLNYLAEALPGKWSERVKPYFYILPAILIVAVYLIYPTIQTIVFSFANANSTAFVGLKNYTDLLGGDADGFHQTLLNTLIWIVVAPAATIILGLVVATLADKLHPRGEKLSKSLVFLPMAIGAVGSATIWKFVYATPFNGHQIGIQNAVWTGLGFQPVDWLRTPTGHLNTFELIIVYLWTQIGFSMVLLSAAIKGVPAETIEAARIDGANELQIFFRVVVPQIWVTVVAVFITVLIGTLKVFDVIYVTTGGQFNSNVIGVEFFKQITTFNNQGYAAAIVVILLIAVSPIMYYQVRQFRAQEAMR